MLGAPAIGPLTVKQGRELVERYDRRVDHLDPPPYTHSDAMALQMKDVWFRYERDLPDVLRGVSLSVYEGECLCILGGNGTGKTTALRVLSGLNKPYRGTVRIGGQKDRGVHRKRPVSAQYSGVAAKPAVRLFAKNGARGFGGYLPSDGLSQGRAGR